MLPFVLTSCKFDTREFGVGKCPEDYTEEEYNILYVASSRVSTGALHVGPSTLRNLRCHRKRIRSDQDWGGVQKESANSGASEALQMLPLGVIA